MRLPETVRSEWLDMARRLSEMPSALFFDGRDYHAIFSEAHKLVFAVYLLDADRAARRPLDTGVRAGTVEWIETVQIEEVIVMLHVIFSSLRWSDDYAAAHHSNGFLAAAFARVAEAEGDFQVAA